MAPGKRRFRIEWWNCSVTTPPPPFCRRCFRSRFHPIADGRGAVCADCGRFHVQRWEGDEVEWRDIGEIIRQT